jgi:RNA polymerase sigma-70 factor (ECF subfamily)
MAVSDDLVKRAAAGDRHAQEGVYELLNNRVFRTILRIVGQADADDVTQDAFVNIFKKMHTFRFDSDFATWAHRLAVNDALQHLRRARKTSMVSLDESWAVTSAPQQELDARELLERALARLDAEQRLILELKEVDKLPYGEIAEVLGIPEGTVGSRLNRARRDLHAYLSDSGWGEAR